MIHKQSLPTPATEIKKISTSSGTAATSEINSRRLSATSLCAASPECAELLANPASLVGCLAQFLLELPLLAPNPYLVKESLVLADVMLGLLVQNESPAADTVFLKLTKPLLQGMGPVALYACRDCSDGSTAWIMAQLHQVYNVCVPHWVLDEEGTEQILTTYTANPLACYAVMETVLRSTVTLQNSFIPGLSAIIIRFACTCAWLCDPCTAGVPPYHTPVAASTSLSHRQLAVQQFALLLTALKVSKGRLQSSPELRWMALQATGRILQVAVCQARKLRQGQRETTEESKAHNRDTMTVWLVLLARSCRQVADLLSAEYQGAEHVLNDADRHYAASRLSRFLSPQGLLERCIGGLGAMHEVVQLSEYLPGCAHGTAAAGNESNHHQLEANHGNKPCTTSASKLKVTATWDKFVGVFDPSSLQQLMHVADQVVALVPIRHCCNNPTCSGTASVSELNMVNSKGTICGGCKVSRYCDRGCQVLLVAHWKATGGYTAICKKLQSESVSQSTV